MDTIKGIRTFIGVVDTGSFTAAAQRMSMSVSLVSKYISQLEDRLDTRLLNRTTRSLTLTEIGTAYYQQSQLVLKEFDELEGTVKEKQTYPCGHLVISAPQTFGEMFLIPLINKFLMEYPEISIDLRLTDRLINFVNEEIDVSIRVAELSDSNLVARFLEPARIICCASKEYLKMHGRPQLPTDLKEHTCIIDNNFKKANKWPFLVDGKKEVISVNGKFITDNARVTRDMVLSGNGISMIPLFAVSEDIKAGKIEILLEEYEAFNLDVNVIYLHRRHLAAKIRAFVDFIAMNMKVVKEVDKSVLITT